MPKHTRLLELYTRLSEGHVIQKTAEAKRYGVDERSIQRDIDDLRAYLSETKVENTFAYKEIIYDRAQKGFRMIGSTGSNMSNDEILAVSKILLESRAFTKEEIADILEKLVAGCVPLKNRKLVSELISNEKFHYVELTHHSVVKEKLWSLGEEIKHCNLLQITYGKKVSAHETVQRIIQPVGLIFSEYYFYLNAFIMEKNAEGNYVHKYEYPAVFRLDRIHSYQKIGEKYCMNYADRFEEGEFRKRVQFMFPGKLIRLQFRYRGRNVEAILDRLPTATILSEDEHGTILEAEVYGKGILMWLLSQGSMVEVLRPQSLREEMRDLLGDMLKMYCDKDESL